MEDLRILCIGLVCIDIINEVESFPLEDSDIRCLSQHTQRGGNASNNCTLLGILGAKPEFFGTIPDTEDKEFIENDFRNFGVDISKAVVSKDSQCPTSYVIVSMATGSRTIIHNNKKLKEPSFEDFCRLNLDSYSWIHFEGRNVSVVKRAIGHVRQINKLRERKLKISVEIEKPKPEIDDFFSLGDFVFVSKDYAQFRGWRDVKEAVGNMSQMIHEEATVICPWGEKGAGAMIRSQGALLVSQGFPPERVLDTLGAGDTFIASTIFALASGETVEHSITFGCKIAGSRIGFKGWSEFRTSVHDLDCMKTLVGKVKQRKREVEGK